jgi:DNA-binding NarL/FixJ family response regulator
VKTQRANVMHKLGVHSMVELIQTVQAARNDQH